METIQGWVDATRDWVDPLYGMMAVVALGLLCVWWLNRPPTTRDFRAPGGHYLGKITPKTLPKMLQDAPQPEENPGPPANSPQTPAPPEAEDNPLPGQRAEDEFRRMRMARKNNPPRKMH